MQFLFILFYCRVILFYILHVRPAYRCRENEFTNSSEYILLDCN